jgi:hypothetical protein
MGGHCVLRLAVIFLCGGVFQIFDLKTLIEIFCHKFPFLFYYRKNLVKFLKEPCFERILRHFDIGFGFGAVSCQFSIGGTVVFAKVSTTSGNSLYT